MTRLVLILVLGPLLYLAWLISPASFRDEEIRFVVPPGEKRETTVKRLLDDGIARNATILDFVASLSAFPDFSGWEIEPGAYNLGKNRWLTANINTLLYHPYQKWVLLKPGLRKEQVAEILAEKLSWDVLAEKEFLENSEEGYLFPDTYLIDVAYSPREVYQKLKSNFNEKFEEKTQNDLLKTNVRNDTAIKIASLIERESGGPEDKALISGVIWNRLDTGMKLQIDAATQYIIGTRGNWWPRVRPQDNRIDSLYNTYIHKGLPPTPISSPSLDSIRAAVYPAETDCLFYTHDANKKIHCTKTYAKHLENIELYLK